MISGDKRSINIWPGYVDALSAILMVVIFVILIFTIAQFLLSEILTGKESELVSLHRQIDQLVRQLGLEEQQNRALQTEMSNLSLIISDLTEEKKIMTSRLEEQSRQSQLDRKEIKQQLLLMASLQEDIDKLRVLRQQLERQVGTLTAALKDKKTEVGNLRDRTKALEARMADERERTLLAQKEIAQSEIRIQALSALVGDQMQALEKEQQLSKNARAEVALLNRQIKNMQRQLAEISRALQLAEAKNLEQQDQLKDLGRRLNIELARRVNRLERYQSEFFGRLREILGDNPYIRIEGDRFVLQSELLFESGSANLGESGRSHLNRVADTLKQLAGKIPEDLNWILRIDGHTDRMPIRTAKFASNWELSTARAVSVVRFLAEQGIPESRMTAAGFSKFHPIDPADTFEAYRKNRRIEIKLTSR
jgi:chemotaxis protein MotB